MVLDRFKDKNVYCVTDADLDGVASHIVSLLYVKPICRNFISTITAKRDMSEFEKEFSDKSEVVIFVDIAPTLDLYKELIAENKEVFIFDHHITSYDILKNDAIDNYFFTEEKCGARILFDKVTEGKRINKSHFQFIELVDTYDRWQQKSSLWKDAEKLQNIMYGYVNWFDNTQTDNEKYLVFIEKQLEKFQKGRYFYFTRYEDSLQQKAEDKKKRNLVEARKSLIVRTDDSGNTYGYFECSAKLSIIANILLDEYQNITYMIGHSTYLEKVKKEENGKISLRSRSGFDVNTIAEKYDGGGHAQASGVELSMDAFKKLRSGEQHLI